MEKHTKNITCDIFAFVFVAGVMLFKSNMYQWQLQSVRHRFGSWIIMLYDSNLEENSELKNHPYLNESGKAAVDNYMYDTKKQQDVSSVKLGYMSDEFISIGNISLREGSMPQEDDEAAIEWDTLIKLNQGTTIGQDIVINIRKSNSPYSDVIEKHISSLEYLITIPMCGQAEIMYPVLY